MSVLSNLLVTIAAILDLVAFNIIPLIYWLIIIRAVLSWVNPDPYNPIVKFIHMVTEPLLAPLRGLIPSYRIGLDLSPLIAIFGLMILKIIIHNLFVQTLLQLAQSMKQ